MSDYNRAIAELRKKINARDKEILNIRISIGQEISLLKSTDIKDTPVFESHSKVRDLKKAIPSKNKIIKEITKHVNSIEDLDKRIGDSKVILGEREKSYRSIYEHIGTAAYSAYKANREKLRNYEHIFTELGKLDARLVQFNKVAIPGNDSEKNFIKQVVDTAKSMYMNQKHKFIQLRYPGLYRQAGKALLTTDFIEDAAFAPLDEAMNPLIENEKTIAELNKTINTLQDERKLYEETLLSLEVKDKPQKKIREIYGEISYMEKQIVECYVEMYEISFKNNLFKEMKNEKIMEYIGKLGSLENDNKQSEKEIRRYETLIAIDKLNGKIGKASIKIEHIKNQIAKQEQELKVMEKEFSQLEKQKNVLEKTLEVK